MGGFSRITSGSRPLVQNRDNSLLRDRTRIIARFARGTSTSDVLEQTFHSAYAQSTRPQSLPRSRLLRRFRLAKSISGGQSLLSGWARRLLAPEICSPFSEQSQCNVAFSHYRQ